MKREITDKEYAALKVKIGNLKPGESLPLLSEIRDSFLERLRKELTQ